MACGDYPYQPSYITPNVSFQSIWEMYSKPSVMLSSIVTTKEKDMAIGGATCHLCGAQKVFESSEAYKSKFDKAGMHSKYESYIYIDYACGTTVELGNKRKGSVEKNKEPKVIVGKKCIKVPAA